MGANSFGTFQAAFAVYGLVNQLFNPTPSDTDKILGAIDRLGQMVAKDFEQLGDLLKQQIHLVIQNEDTLEMANRLAMSSTASDKLARFIRGRDPADLRDADTWSDQSIQFFLNLPLPGPVPTASRTDPFFMPAVVKAGTIRILVITVQDPDYRSVDSNQITNISNLLQGMIDRLKTEIDNAHTVSAQTHLAHSTPPRVIYDGYNHQEHGITLKFFSAAGATDPGNPNDPRAALARTQAQSHRNSGVSAEQAFVGVPQFEALVQSWQRKNTLAPPMQRVSGVGTSDAPASTFKSATGEVYLAWKGADNDSGIYWSTTRNLVPTLTSPTISWTQQQRVPGVGTSAGPALTCFRGTVYLAWKGAGNDAGIWWSQCGDGITWSPQQPVPLARTSSAPALVATTGANLLALEGRGKFKPDLLVEEHRWQDMDTAECWARSGRNCRYRHGQLSGGSRIRRYRVPGLESSRERYQDLVVPMYRRKDLGAPTTDPSGLDKSRAGASGKRTGRTRTRLER